MIFAIVHAIAGEFDLNIYVLSLSMKRLDDPALNALVSRLPSQSILLIEDIDVAFFHGLDRDKQEAPLTGLSTPSGASAALQQQSGGTNITLAGLLAAIDGVSAQEGRVLFASTNNIDALDPALIRPGRLDVHIKFDYATKWQIEKLYANFFPASSEANVDDRKVNSGSAGLTMTRKFVKE